MQVFQVLPGLVCKSEMGVVKIGDVDVWVLAYEAVRVAWPCSSGVVSHAKLVFGQRFEAQGA